MIKQFITKRRQKGSFLIEMAIVSWVLIYMLVGSFQMGLMLVRAMQAGSVCRSGAVLEARGIDLSQTLNQELLLRTGPALGINTVGAWTPNASGSGRIILSQVYDVGPLECAAGIDGWVTGDTTCTNLGSNVVRMQISIGNTTYGPSAIGSPSSTTQSTGYITDAQVCTVAANVTTKATMITLAEDQYAWVSEVFADSSAYNIFPWFKAPTIYMRNFS